MNKTKKKKTVIVIFVLLLILLGVFGGIEYKKIDTNNSEIEELVNTDRGTFRDLDSEYPTKGVLISLFDLDGLSIDNFLTDKEKKEELNRWKKYNIDLEKIKEPCFMFKYGAMGGYEPDNFVFGSWKRNEKGDYELTVKGKSFAHIIEKKNDGFIKKKRPEYVLIINDTGEKYYIQKVDNSSRFF